MCSLDRDKPSLHILRVGVGTTSGNGGAVKQKAQVDLTFRHCNVLPMLQASRHHVWPPHVTWFKNCCSPTATRLDTSKWSQPQQFRASKKSKVPAPGGQRVLRSWLLG